MSSEADRFWDEIAGKLQKKKGFCPLTPEEAEAAFNAARDVPLSEGRIDAIVRAATSGDTEVDDPGAGAVWSDEREVAGRSHQLCRNKGDDDPNADQDEKDLEEELLKDGEENEI